MSMRKIEFPLYMAIDPTPKSVLNDVCVEISDFSDLENMFLGLSQLTSRGYQARNPALYTARGGAEADARARLDARDAAKTTSPTALFALLDRIDTDGKSLPADVREEIAQVLKTARDAGWRP